MSEFVIEFLRFDPESAYKPAQAVLRAGYINAGRVEPYEDIRFRFVRDALEPARNKFGLPLRNKSEAKRVSQAIDARIDITSNEMQRLPMETWKAVVHACLSGPDVMHALADRWGAEHNALKARVPLMVEDILREQGITAEPGPNDNGEDL
jgi:hypothetical protein